MSEITPIQPPAPEATGPAPLRGREGVAALLRKAASEQRGEKREAPPAPEEESDDLPPPDVGNAGIKDGAPAPQDESPTEPAGEPIDEEIGGGDAVDDLDTLAMDGLAERAGLSLEELFAVELPLGDERDPITLGTLKDRFTELARVDDSRNLLDEQRTSFENDMIRSKQELAAVVAQLPQLPPGLVQQALAAQQQTLDDEREKLRAIKPEWKDPETFRAAQDDILEAIAPYGFNRNDMDLIMDHRLIKFAYDHAQLKKKFAAAQAIAKEVGGTGKRLQSTNQRVGKAASKKRERAEILKRAKAGNSQEKVRGVAALLRGE